MSSKFIQTQSDESKSWNSKEVSLQTNQTVVSEHVQEYKKISRTQEIEIFQNPLDILLSSGLIQWEPHYKDQITTCILETDIESFKLEIHYANFKTKVNVLMTNLDQRFFEGKSYRSGSFGMIYQAQNFDKKNFVIKAVDLKVKQYESDLKEICKEYFMTLIASILKIGPKLLNVFGYNIITTRDKGFFSIQKCDFIRYEELEKLKYSIYNDLKNLHELRFIHSDIKPENIMYSPSYHKYVFIDFGLSRIITQTIGYKTLTAFCGSLKYCSEEMKTLYLIGEKSYVDLYHNDAVCLQKTFETLQSVLLSEREYSLKNQSEIQNRQSLSEKYISQSIPVFQFKLFLFQGQISKALQKVSYLNNFKKTILTIFNNRKEGHILEPQFQEMYTNVMKSLINENLQTNELDEILSSQFKDFSLSISYSYCFTLSSLLKIDKTKLRKMMQSQRWVYRIFLCFDPFFNEKLFKSRESSLKYINLQLELIEKIWGIIKEQNGRLSGTMSSFSTVENFQQIPISIKIRKVLRFLYNKLIKMKITQTLYCFRYLFILIEDWAYVSQVQKQILQSTKNSIKKLLKICEFIYYWYLVWDTNYIFQNEEYHKIVQNTQTCDSAYSQIFLFLKQRLLQILKNKSIHRHQKLTEFFSLLIKQCNPLYKDFKQQIFYIKLLAHEGSYFHRVEAGETYSLKHIIWGKLYMIQMAYMHPLNMGSGSFKNQCLVSLRVEIMESVRDMVEGKCYWMYGGVEEMVRGLLEDFEFWNQCVSEKCLKMVVFYLMRVVPAIQVFCEIVQRKMRDLILKETSQFKIRKALFYYYLFVFQCILHEQFFVNSEYQKLRIMITLFFKEANSSDIVDKILHTDPGIVILFKMIVIIFLIMKSGSTEKERAFAFQKINQVQQIMNNDEIKLQIQLAFFSTISQSIFYLPQGEKRTQLQETCLRISRSYCSQHLYVRFCKFPRSFFHFITLLNNRGLYEQSFVNILNCCAYCDKIVHNYYPDDSLICFLSAFSKFILTTPIEKLCQFYKQIYRLKQQLTKGCFALTVCLIFHYIYPQFSIQQREMQIKRSILSEKNMCTFEKKCLISVIPEIYHSLNRTHTRRKLLSILKKDFRYTEKNTQNSLEFLEAMRENCFKIRNTLIRESLETKIKEISINVNEHETK